MLEADVSQQADGTPIMAHPPSTDSTFWREIAAVGRVFIVSA